MLLREVVRAEAREAREAATETRWEEYDNARDAWRRGRGGDLAEAWCLMIRLYLRWYDAATVGQRREADARGEDRAEM